jgi:alpha-galactosidase
MAAGEIELDNGTCRLVMHYADDVPLTLSRLQWGDVRLELDPGVPAIELQTVAAGHQVPVQGLTHSMLGRRLRHRSHQISHQFGWHTLLVQLGLDGLAGSDGVAVELRLRMPAGIAAFTSELTISNPGPEEVVLTSAPTWSMAVTGKVAFRATAASDLDLWSGASDWLGENRWSSRPLRETVVDLASAQHAVDAKGVFASRSQGGWSTAGELPVGAVSTRAGGYALAWQIEHNGGWRWEIGDQQHTIGLTLSGPTESDHQWVAPLGPNELFRTVPVTVGLGRDFTEAVRSLTRYRRAARRPHPDNHKLTLVYNDYMNTLMGDPTTERVLPLVDAAAAAGAEAFCIDAGWYDDDGLTGEPMSWWDSVGAWQPARSRFPGGLAEVLERIRQQQMVPGLWLEPEVVGVRSPIAAELPDGAFFSRYGHRVLEAGRFQLDLRHPSARRHLDKVVDRLVGELGVGYLKMDYNINPAAGTDHRAPSAGAGLLGHNRAVLDWIDALLDRHPDLILENCASGAMRCDFAMLSRLQLQSTSDQQDVSRSVPIALAAPVLMLPEQAASWAYPSSEMSAEETVTSLSLGLLGRLYLSGFLHELAPQQRDLVAEAVKAHKELRGWISTALPGWPLGLPRWQQPWSCLALSTADRTVLTVVKRSVEASSVAISLPDLVGRELQPELVFPRRLEGWSFGWEPASGTLRVDSQLAGLTARTLSLTG